MKRFLTCRPSQPAAEREHSQLGRQSAVVVQSIVPQVKQMSAALKGVDNLAGHMIATDVIARELGIVVSDVTSAGNVTPTSLQEKVGEASFLTSETSAKQGVLTRMTSLLAALSEENRTLKEYVLSM
jgi:hypothetical protein